MVQRYIENGADCVMKEGKCNPKINKEVRANGIDYCPHQFHFSLNW